MNLYEHAMYQEDLQKVASLPLPWDKLRGAGVLISGASGMIGSFLTDVLMYQNSKGLGCRVYALGRSRERLAGRFSYWEHDEGL
ncbi:MAG: SDR family NAD-dependent epimerase/dehydratase, partial [Lachnospiraceae bacterium]|nr:SDR family NAD-dependent epimerase/dehydratase [Lachnospiraceae bacterium]